MNATNDLNAPYRRNDAYTTHAVMSHIQAKYPGEFGELHIAACINEARRCPRLPDRRWHRHNAAGCAGAVLQARGLV